MLGEDSSKKVAEDCKREPQWVLQQVGPWGGTRDENGNDRGRAGKIDLQEVVWERGHSVEYESQLYHLPTPILGKLLNLTMPQFSLL